ncbi:MAG: 50S ribosomal protein L21, partial [Chloroflexi bacterium]|nr:50S ribosomal protein L21 [Chloroflexota bacterium]
SIDCTVVEHFKGEKLTIFKYRPKQRFRVKTGHRQKYTRVVVDSIMYPGKPKSTKASESVEEPAAMPVKKGRTKAAPPTKKPAAKSTAKKSTTGKAAPAKKPSVAKKKSS